MLIYNMSLLHVFLTENFAARMAADFAGAQQARRTRAACARNRPHRALLSTMPRNSGRPCGSPLQHDIRRRRPASPLPFRKNSGAFPFR